MFPVSGCFFPPQGNGVKNFKLRIVKKTKLFEER